MTEAVVLDSYYEVVSSIASDLRWYLVYEAVMTAREKLKIEGDFDEIPFNKQELYHYALKVYLTRALEKHVFIGSRVELSVKALREALEYFALKVPLAPTFELGSYLNYLESWANAHDDWTLSSPAAFDSLEIEIRV